MQEFDNVSRPKHYCDSKYECIDVMLELFGTESVKSFCKLNAFKYIWRMDKKNGLEDAKKASWYLDRYISLCEEQKLNVMKNRI